MSYDGLKNPTWIADVRTLAEAVASVIGSPAFQKHMGELSALHAAPGEKPLTGEQVYRSYMGLDPAAKIGPIGFAPKWGRHGDVLPCKHKLLVAGTGQTADTDFHGASGSTVQLNQCTLDRAAARPGRNPGELEDFACAINTIAHEWTHTVYDAKDPRLQLYRDRGRKKSGGMLVSYTVGAVAECTYLESGGHLPGSFADCVEAAGTTILKFETCVKGWAKP